MYGNLTSVEIEHLLNQERVGHLGCCAHGQLYVVPITYAYDGACVYGYTREGRKLSAMRENPAVCFEVERINDLMNWQSVIAWGTFEELSGDDAAKAEVLIRDQTMPVTAGAPIALLHGMGGWGTHDATWQTPVRYRIHLTRKSGRFERL